MITTPTPKPKPLLVAFLVGNSRHRAASSRGSLMEEAIYMGSMMIPAIREDLEGSGVEAEFVLRPGAGPALPAMQRAAERVNLLEPDLVVSLHARPNDATPGTLALVAPRSKKARAVAVALTAAVSAAIGQPDLGVQVGEPEALPPEFGLTSAPLIMLETHLLAGDRPATLVAEGLALADGIAAGLRAGLGKPSAG